ncbi:creatininase family protein [Tenacibaculum maritimum]|uniref:creatininase family protein n=1 Tax=Tenacibaculum maritimum TaxID=107401 RepID=UPI0004256C78|nr:creatininase family protein [Tenacibaculum maritimum]MCD9562541.1 creatininase family protein [Tenacibaculum maritimum]MCD9564920.1 creatininase family protein [Tenacibaculum maritimum]MCD9577699.1 creatininase family protein [Tenacibaculum maritimum]MCD9583721.1 creatininase family protein [Tenacibaculum maritimum]MCD9595639.1 creatininase family protein [Tenacibaculum maritimum]
MKPRPYVLTETNYKTIKEIKHTVAILPWGATEPHNYHLPYGTDNIQAERVSIEAAKIASENNAKVMVLPTIPFGVNTGQLDLPLCMNMNPSTQHAILKDIVHVLNLQKVLKLVIINAHGGNNFKQIIRELSVEFPSVFICSLNWWQITNTEKYFDEPGDHAGELETATMMYLTPDLVLPLKEAGNGNAKSFKLKGLKEGWVSSQRQWTAVSKDTGVGNPKKATKEKGQLFFEFVTKKIASFLEELHHADLNDMYE